MREDRRVRTPGVRLLGGEAVAHGVMQDELHAAIHTLNRSESIHGFLIQHPLPRHLDFGRALLEMDPAKDADGLHPRSIGNLAVGLEAPVPATPAGVRAILLHYGIPTSGRNVVIIG